MELKTRIRSAYAQVNEARLYYEERGAGFPLLFIPGGSVDASHYEAVAERLADEFRTVTFDRRGNGRSPRPPGWHATTIAEQADDVAGLIEALGLAPCAVWAGSLGGVILLELLLRRPGLISVAIVHEPPLFGVLEDGEQLASGLLASAAGAIREHNVCEAFRDHAHQAIGGAFEGLQTDAQERMFANAEVFFDLEIPALVDYRSAGASRVLRRIDIPLCVMADANNAGAPPVRAARWLAETLGAEFHNLPGGHMPYATEPEVTATAIRIALDRKGGTIA
jgi:pimeloyl-ACP methyl ester carboxylesterase